MKMQKAISTSLIIAIGGFLFGYDIAMISGTTSQLEEAFQLSKFSLGFTVAIALIGTIIGTLIIGKPVDQFGRRKMLLLLSGLFTLTTLGSAMSPIWASFLFFRFLTGILLGCISVVTPMFIAEISPAVMRGRLVLMNQFNVVSAIFLAYVINYLISGMIPEGSWRYMIGIEFIPAFIFFLLLFRVPESPRWMAINNKKEEAIKIFTRIGAENPEVEVKLIIDSIRNQENTGHGKLFGKENRVPVTIAILIAAFNQLAGINAIIYYAPRIFEMSGLGQDASLLQSISIGVTNLLFTVVALFLIDRFGRRTLLMIGSIGMVFFLSMLSKAFFTSNFSDFGGYGIMIYLMGFIAFFAFSQGAVLWVVLSEIFPQKVRAQGQALGSFTHWIMAAAISWLFPVFANVPSIGGGPSFAFFAIMMVFHFFFAWKVLPETKGKSLEEIQEELSNTKK